MTRRWTALRTRVVASAIVIGVVAASFATSVPAGATTAAAGSQPVKGELRFGVTGAEANFCPPSAQWGPTGVQVAAAIYDTLTVPNDQGRMVPYLAESVTPDASTTHWTIALRDGVTFHDGEPLDAAAVKLNLDAFTGKVATTPAATLLPFVLRFVTQISVVDRLHVLVDLGTAVPDFPAYLFLEGRMAIAAPAQLRSADCATRMIGTGPFELTSLRPTETVASKNDGYWQRGYPKAKRITFTTIFDATQRTSELRSAGVDLIAQFNGGESEKIKGLKGHYSVLDQPTGFRATHAYLLNTDRAPFDDRDARLAVTAAIDRESLNDLISGAHLDEAGGFMDSGAPGYDKDAATAITSADRARELITRVKTKTGGELKPVILIDADGDHLAEARELVTELTAVGMVPTIVQATPQQYPNEVAAGHFDLVLSDTVFGGNAASCDADTTPWWSADSPGNVGGFHDDRITTLLDQARAATTLSEAQTACSALDQAMVTEGLAVPVVYLQWAIGARSGVDLTVPKLPGDGGKPLFVAGRVPVLGLRKS